MPTGLIVPLSVALVVVIALAPPRLTSGIVASGPNTFTCTGGIEFETNTLPLAPCTATPNELETRPAPNSITNAPVSSYSLTELRLST